MKSLFALVFGLGGYSILTPLAFRQTTTSVGFQQFRLSIDSDLTLDIEVK